MPTVPELLTQLDEVKRNIEPITSHHPEGSDLKVLADAVHNLIFVVRILIEAV